MAVGVAPVWSRSNRRTPISRSRSEMLRLRAGWLRCRRSAARAKLPASASATRRLSLVKSIRRLFDRDEQLAGEGAALRIGAEVGGVALEAGAGARAQAGGGQGARIKLHPGLADGHRLALEARHRVAPARNGGQEGRRGGGL